jgi:hypothetical protein
VTAGDLAAVLLGVAALVVIAATTALWFHVRAAARDLRSAVEEARREVGAASAAAAQAERHAARVEHLLTRSEGVVDRVDAASELAYETFSRPVIKAMAVGVGTRQAVRRLRSREAPADPSEAAQ